MPLADTLASPLIGAYAEVWDGLVGELETLTDPAQWRRREHIRELLVTIDKEFRGLEPAVRQFTDRDLKDVYGLGHSWSATTAGVQGVFAIQYNETLGVLESGLRERLLAENKAASELMQRQVRDAARTATRSSVAAGTPAQAAARQMTETLRGAGLHSVTYNDGSRRSIKTYSEMAVRTTTAQAYNEGSFELGKQIGVAFYEVFDGPTCGWTFHEDTDLADGKIVTDDEARAWPISHPNCRRSFGARPDLTERPDGKVEHRISPPTSAAEAQERARLESGGLLRERRRTGRRSQPGQPRAAARPEPNGPQRVRGRYIADDIGDADDLYIPPSERPSGFSAREDVQLKRLWAEQGYDGLPAVRSADEVDRLINEEGWTEIWRGMKEAPDGLPYAERFRTGEHFAGEGLHGNGAYFTTNAETAQAYAGGNGSTVRAALPPDANVLDVSRRSNFMNDLQQKSDAAFPKPGSVEDFNAAAEKAIDIGDPSYAAVLRGADATRVVRENGEVYYVIQNRTALVVQDA